MVEGDDSTGISILRAGEGDDMEYDEAAYNEFILADHDLGEIQEFLTHYDITDDNWDELVDEESTGANRSDVLDWINEQRS